MTDNTFVAVYDTVAHAEAAVADLKAAGIPANAISMHADNTPFSAATTQRPAREEGFWASLFGGEPDHDTAVYDRSLEGGSTVVSVSSADAHADRVMEILESHRPIDIDERATGYGLTQTATRDPVPATTPAPLPGAAVTAPNHDHVDDHDQSLQLSEEELSVGKRLVNRGGTRIRRYVVETPVEQRVSLHEEKVVLDRHPVTDARPAADSFSDKSIEMIETSEEAVIAKTAHVYEEVGLRKERAERVETVRDTVRKEQAEIEQLPGTPTNDSKKTLSPKV